jgi:hypothetical protein
MPFSPFLTKRPSDFHLLKPATTVRRALKENHQVVVEATLARDLQKLHGYDFVVIYEPAKNTVVGHFLVSDSAVDPSIQEELFRLFDMTASET